VHRAVLATVGGYAITALLVSLFAALLFRSGTLTRSEAVTLAAMLGFPTYLVLLMWGLYVDRIARTWRVYGCVAAVAALCVVLLSETP
jgi:hypothetical protein